MVISAHEAYFILTIPFIFVWFIIFFLSKTTRKEQLIMSFLFLPFGPLSELLYFRDYWRPQSVFSFTLIGIPILLEDLLFIFAIAGIGSVIYELLFKIKPSYKISKIRIHWPIILLMCAVISIALFQLGINSIFATSIAFVTASFLIVAQQKDLLADSLLSGFSIMLIMFISYFFLINVIRNSNELIKTMWLLTSGPLDIRLFKIPLTELVWGFSWGMFLGPLYEFVKRFASRNGENKM